ncbi:sigma factor [Streptomyces solicavernae]|uniref:sigma factor n=1 Tax=Streptomyces solicavernae TaxID=3043614 RepID=UPI0038D0148B
MNVRNESYEGVLQVGAIGLIKAIDRFLVQRGTEFPTSAMPTIFGEIKRFYRATTWSVHVPRRLQELRIDLTKDTAQLDQTHGRVGDTDPTGLDPRPAAHPGTQRVRRPTAT